MASLSHFSDVFEQKLNAYIKKAVPEKTKIAKTYDIKTLKGKQKMNLKYQFDSFIWQWSHAVNIETNETWHFKNKYFWKSIVQVLFFFFRDFY